MIDPQPLNIEGTRLSESDGTVVATLNDALGERVEAYARLFAASAEMMELLEAVLIQEVDEFEQQVRSARGAVPLTGVMRSGPDKLYTTLPEWVQTGLALLAKIKA